MRITRERLEAQEQKKKDLDRLARRGHLRPLKKRASDDLKKAAVEKSDKNIAAAKEKTDVAATEKAPESADEKQKKRRLAGLLRRLRGTPKKQKPEDVEPVEYVDVSVDNETGEYVEEENVKEYTAFEEDVSEEQNWEQPAERQDTEPNVSSDGFHFIFKKDPTLPNGLISTALSVAVGLIYYDETGRLVDRLVTVRRIFGRGGDIIIDAFCHDIEAPRMILFSKAVRLYDIKTLFAYADPVSFLLRDIGGYVTDESFKDDGFIRALSIVRYDLAALAYLAKVDADKSELENRLIFSYVKRRCATVPFDDEQMLRYISRLFPDEQSFYEAVDVIAKQPQEDLQLFVETFLQLVLSDSVIHDNERELLAELLYVLRLQGVELNILGLK